MIKTQLIIFGMSILFLGCNTNQNKIEELEAQLEISNQHIVKANQNLYLVMSQKYKNEPEKLSIYYWEVEKIRKNCYTFLNDSQNHNISDNEYFQILHFLDSMNNVLFKNEPKKFNKIDSFLNPKKYISKTLLKSQIINIQYTFYNNLAKYFAGDYCGFSILKLIPKDKNTLEVLYKKADEPSLIICINKVYKDKKKTELSPSIKYNEVIGEIGFDKFEKGTYVIEGEVISTEFLRNWKMPFNSKFKKE